MSEGTLGPRGALAVQKIGARQAPLAWRVRNALRWAFIKGWIAFHLVRPVANWWGLATMIAALSIRVRRADGTWEDFGIVGYRVITDAGVAFLVDDWDANGQDISTLNFHGIGTGGTAEAVGQTALVTESTTALNPDSTRATGTRSQPAANQYQTVGTLTADASIAATEHGLFSQAATGGGTMWDRTLFTVINLASGDSIQTTYTATVSSGG